MEGVNKKKKRLHVIFIAYLLVFCILTAVLAVVIVSIYTMLATAGVIRYPTYEQDRIAESAEQIQACEDGEEKWIPDSCKFAVFSEDGDYLRGTATPSDAAELWDNWEQGTRGTFYNTFYREIEKDNGEKVLVSYQMFAKFENSLLRKWIPNAEFLFLFLYLMMVLGGIVWISRSFGKYLRKRLAPLECIAVKVENQDLNFDCEYSDIQEIDQVLGSLYRMKDALQASLKEQWKERRRKEEQIAALAHDIKTPLTIIRGNAELISEAKDCQEIAELDREILMQTADVEHYLSVLQETLCTDTRRQKQEVFHQQTCDTGRFLRMVREQALALCRGKGLKLVCDFPDADSVSQQLEGGLREWIRAAGNVISNGTEYCTNNGILRIRAEEKRQSEREYLCITITDDGSGFSAEALQYGTERFYQGDKSRSRKAHYGMGLYIARSIAEQSGGRLEIGNSGLTGGGEVKIYIPVID